MPYSRFSTRQIFLNNTREYKNSFFKSRGIQQLYQFGMPRISYPTPEEKSSLDNRLGVWKATDTLYNIANSYYGAPEYWWVIAWYNKKASEAEFKVGDQFYVPLPLESVLAFVE
jgi:hypothetical protein